MTCSICKAYWDDSYQAELTPKGNSQHTQVHDPALGQLIVHSGRQDHSEDPTLPNGGVDTSCNAERETGKMPEGTAISSVEEKIAESGPLAYTSGMSCMIATHAFV